MNSDDLRAESERLHEDVIHSEKGLLAASTAWGTAHLSLGIAATIAGTVAAASGFRHIPVVTVTAGVIAAILSALITFLKPSEREKEYRDAGRGYADLRGALRRFANLEVPTGDPGELRDRIEQLAGRKAALDRDAPSIPRWAFKRGKASIDAGEAAYRIDEEE